MVGDCCCHDMDFVACFCFFLVVVVVVCGDDGGPVAGSEKGKMMVRGNGFSSGRRIGRGRA